VTRDVKPYSTIDKAGNPPDTLDHHGSFHKPTSWDISPVGLPVTLKVTNADGVVLLSATVPATSAQHCSGNPNNQCFRTTTNPNGYEYKDLTQAPFGGIQKIKLHVDAGTTNMWKLIVQGKSMADTIGSNPGLDDLVESNPGELIWHLEIGQGGTAKPTLRSNIVYSITADARKLKYPKP
jgi:hypothetical protein